MDRLHDLWTLSSNLSQLTSPQQSQTLVLTSTLNQYVPQFPEHIAIRVHTQHCTKYSHTHTEFTK